MLHARRTILICGIATFVVCSPMSSMAQTPPPVQKQTLNQKQPPGQKQSPLQKLKDCLLIEDGYKERLDCYDAVIRPEPRPSPKKAKVVAECRFFKEEDKRLACFNGFVDPRKQPPPKAVKPPAKKPAP
jgi:hypothetical protein